MPTGLVTVPTVLPCTQPTNHSHGKMFLYLFFALLSSATTVDEPVFLSMDCGYRNVIYVSACNNETNNRRPNKKFLSRTQLLMINHLQDASLTQLTMTFGLKCPAVDLSLTVVSCPRTSYAVLNVSTVSLIISLLGLH